MTLLPFLFLFVKASLFQKKKKKPTVIFLNANCGQKRLLCHHLRSPMKALILKDPLLFQSLCTSVLWPMGEEGGGQFVGQVRSDAALLGKSLNKS